jgi:hypothetical protein
MARWPLGACLFSGNGFNHWFAQSRPYWGIAISLVSNERLSVIYPHLSSRDSMIYHSRDTDLLGNLSHGFAHVPPDRFPGRCSPPLRRTWLCTPAHSISGCDPSKKSDWSTQTLGVLIIQPLPAGLACTRCQHPLACGNVFDRCFSCLNFDRCLSILLSDPLGRFWPPAPLQLASICSSASLSSLDWSIHILPHSLACIDH